MTQAPVMDVPAEGDTRTPLERRAAEKKADLENEKLKLEIDELKAGKLTAPSFDGIDRGVTSQTAEGSTLFAALLGGRALTAAAAQVMRKVKARVSDDFTVLVTTDVDLVTRDGLYRSVVTSLNELATALTKIPEPSTATGIGQPEGLDPISSALSLVPAVLNLLSPNRTLTASSSTLDDTVVAMTVTGLLAESDSGATVWSDRSRLLSDKSELEKAWANVRAQAEGLRDKVEQHKKRPAAEQDEQWLDRAGDALAKVDRTLSLIAEPSAAGSASLLASARLQEALHEPDLDAILVVKGGAASASQLVGDRALWAKDPLSIVSTASIAYLILDPKTSKTLGGGLAHGTAQLHGAVGSKLDLEGIDLQQ